MENIRFRRANLEDKTDILMLREDVHGGRDILPSMINHILSSPKFIPGVMLDGKRIVSNATPVCTNEAFFLSKIVTFFLISWLYIHCS